MTKKSINLLSESDLEYISAGSIPMGPRPDLVDQMADGRVIFTIKGAQFYTALMASYGINRNLNEISTWADFLDFRRAMLQLRAGRIHADLEQDLNAGRIPAQDVAKTKAILYGTGGSLLDALESVIALTVRTKECKQAGSNVIPIGNR